MIKLGLYFIHVEEKCKVTEVETVNLDDERRKTRWNLAELYESLFLITPKEVFTKSQHF